MFNYAILKESVCVFDFYNILVMIIVLVYSAISIGSINLPFFQELFSLFFLDKNEEAYTNNKKKVIFVVCKRNKTFLVKGHIYYEVKKSIEKNGAYPEPS